MGSRLCRPHTVDLWEFDFALSMVLFAVGVYLLLLCPAYTFVNQELLQRYQKSPVQSHRKETDSVKTPYLERLAS